LIDGEIDTEREDYDRQDLLLPTSNKQLNFLQHIMTVPALDPSARLRGACNRGHPAR
jgi:type I restriction enzyme M protein